MKLFSFLPPLSITAYVSSILVIENDGFKNDFMLPLYANGSPTLVFQTAKAVKQNSNIGNLTLYGHTIKPTGLQFNSSFTLIAYFLQPHALKSLFAIKAGELTDEFIDISALKQANSINLQEQLLNEPDLQKRLHLINTFIEKLAAAFNNDNKKINFATNALKNCGTISLNEIQKKLNTTERSLQRLFESNVGISPKLYKRVFQFHQAFQQLNQHQYAKLSDIAYQHGFADQSHFIRVFKEFTGLTPNQYLTLSAPYNPEF